MGKIDPVTEIFWSLTREDILKLEFDCTSRSDATLDIGCGTGGYMIALAKKGRECYGVDPLEDLSLKRALKKAAQEKVVVDLCKAVGENLPFVNGIFKMVLCVSTLQHVSDPQGVLEEANRVLRNDGLLLVQVPNYKNIGSILTRKVPEHFTKAFDMSELKNVLVKGKFDLLEIRGHGFFPPLGHRLLTRCYYLLGKKVTNQLIGLLNRFAVLFPSYASSIIILCEKSSEADVAA